MRTQFPMKQKNLIPIQRDEVYPRYHPDSFNKALIIRNVYLRPGLHRHIAVHPGCYSAKFKNNLSRWKLPAAISTLCRQYCPLLYTVMAFVFVTIQNHYTSIGYHYNALPTSNQAKIQNYSATLRYYFRSRHVFIFIHADSISS